MKSKLLIVGIIMLVFGLGNLFQYVPISFGTSFVSPPFPFEHIQLILRDDGGITRQIGYMPIDEVMFHPYWLFWSLILYAGIAVTGFSIWRKRK